METAWRGMVKHSERLQARSNVCFPETTGSWRSRQRSPRNRRSLGEEMTNTCVSSWWTTCHPACLMTDVSYALISSIQCRGAGMFGRKTPSFFTSFPSIELLATRFINHRESISAEMVTSQYYHWHQRLEPCCTILTFCPWFLSVL